ncbi:MAG: hypothetical protein IPJ94_09125 [Chloroflexi bacterium]|nr:hypothetical protein [Chloroflexota bacterium]MBK7916406.1 hypothetical protein [Chloroflexota bacterium]
MSNLSDLTNLKGAQTKTAVSPHQTAQLIYQLYNLTPEEIAIVEGAA